MSFGSCRSPLTAMVTRCSCALDLQDRRSGYPLEMVLAALYHVALPVRTSWRSALPGALVCLGLWVGVFQSGNLALKGPIAWLAHRAGIPMANVLTIATLGGAPARVGEVRGQ